MPTSDRFAGSREEGAWLSGKQSRRRAFARDKQEPALFAGALVVLLETH
jgi:hypothetical protein